MTEYKLILKSPAGVIISRMQIERNPALTIEEGLIFLAKNAYRKTRFLYQVNVEIARIVLKTERMLLMEIH
jgi:hypothetical protein